MIPFFLSFPCPHPFFHHLQFNGEPEADVTALLGVIDSVYLFSYAIFIFASGWVAERMDLRYFLSLGMFLSGLAIFMQGAAFLLEIHSLWYFIVLQVGVLAMELWPCGNNH